MNKHLPVLITLFLIGACSMQEQDTRLVCDCISSTYESGEERYESCFNSDTKEGQSVFNNKSLVFNVSKKLFMLNGSQMGEQFITFEDNVISYSFTGDLQKTTRYFDRVNLTLSEMFQDRDYNFTDSKVWKPYTTYHYQCRLVEGV